MDENGNMYMISSLNLRNQMVKRLHHDNAKTLEKTTKKKDTEPIASPEPPVGGFRKGVDDAWAMDNDAVEV